MQPWHRWREPLAVALLVALTLMLVLRAASLVLAVAAGTAGGLYGTLPGGDDLLLLATAGAVLWCTTPVAGTAEPADEPRGDEPARLAGRGRRAGGRRADRAGLAAARAPATWRR